MNDHFYMRSTKIKSWERREADMTVKVELWQDAPEGTSQNAFEVACYKLGSSTPVLYRFPTLDAASNYYSFFIAHNDPRVSVESLMQLEIEALHKLCAAAQCWLDAAGHLATNHATKCALQRNADEFRQEYAKITS